MSYYQNGQYQQAPPNQPPYHDPYAQQQQQPGQNGGYAGQYAQPQYPGQPTYEQPQGGGPVQQTHGAYQDGYQSPRATSFAGGYGGQQQQQYQPQTYQPQTYNPQAYAQQSPQQPMQQYNPQMYASPTQSPYPQQYNPAAYPEPPSASTSGPLGGNPYGYSPGVPASSSFSPQQPAYQQSPSMSQQQYSPHPQYSPQPPSHQYGYQQTPPLPQRSQTQYGQQPPPPIGQYPQSTYPTENYRPHSQSMGAMQVPPPRENYQISPALPGLSDSRWLPSPPQYHVNDSHRSPSPLYPTDTNVSMPSPPGSTPGPTPPAHGFVSRSNTLDRHPQARPLPGPPQSDVEPEYFPRHSSYSRISHDEADALSQEELYSQVENAVLNAGSDHVGGHRPSISLSRPTYEASSQPTALFAPVSPRDPRLQRNGSIVNGHLSPVPPEAQYSDESDVEAAQGIAMLQQAEDEERSRQSGGSQLRFSGLGSQRNARGPQQQGNASDSDDYGAVDMTSFGGGYDVQLSYGGDPSQLAAGGEANSEGYSQPVSQQSSMRRSHASQSSHLSRGDYDYSLDSIHPFPPFNPAARVDAGGTGGLAEPSALGRRQSYDEGDEYTLMENELPERFPDEPPDINFRQASVTYAPGRPLPPPPMDELGLYTDNRGAAPGQSPYYPRTPEGYVTNVNGQWVPRSASLISHQTAPQVTMFPRSKTDAEERRLRAQGYRSSVYAPSSDAAPASSLVPDLPSLGAKRFMPSKLGAPDFKRCEEPWALSAILKWLLSVISPETSTELKEAEVKDALVALFTNKVPTMNIADAEGLSNNVVASMFAAGTLVKTEEWVKLVPGKMSGVMFQLSRQGCYAPTLHEHLTPGRCYARHCQRTLKKVNLHVQPAGKVDVVDWQVFYHLTLKDVEGKESKEIARQNNIHEIVTSEELYMGQLAVLGTIYRDQLNNAEPSIISPKRKDKFMKDVFGRVEAVKKANEEHLLPQLKYRQQEQGPWIAGFSDILRQWIRKAKTAYLDYASGFPKANFLVRQELNRNLEFGNFIEKASRDVRSNRLQWDHYLKTPITRLQRYTLLIKEVLKNTPMDSEEKKNLQIAHNEIKDVTVECDARVAEQQRKVDLQDLQTKLVLRPKDQGAVELNLDHFGRELIFRGDLQRMGESRFTWLDSHALLFDHYLVLAKLVVKRAERGGRMEQYDVSRLPIPMDLLILESEADPAVQKSTYVKGITSVTTVTGRGGTPADFAGLARTQTAQMPAPGGLQHVNTGASMASLQPVTSVAGGDGKDSDRIMYPFKIKHLGGTVYTLFAPNEQARREWTTKIREAKTKHAAALYAQHAEPFRLRVMADSAFVYDAFGMTLGAGKGSIPIQGTPVDRAVKEVELRFKDKGRPAPICRARVNCATTFTTMGASGGRHMVAVGTDFGVYISEIDNPRGWTRAIQMSRVTQVSVLEDFNLFLLISDKSLIAYHLDVICPNERNGPAASTSDSSSRKAPQKLSGSKDVGFFVSGRMKDRQLVFYKKRENLASVFKVLEPIYQKSTEKKRAGIFKRGTTEFFREYDEFYIPAECTGINLFHSSLAVSTARGFEVMTLERKLPTSVPDLKQPHVQNIASHIKDQKALGMLRLSEQEFLLVYSLCAVYVNKHGDVSRSVIMDFVGTAQSAALYGAYLILFDTDFVEIRNAQNGRLKQIIAGREIKCLDDGGSWSAMGAMGAGGQQNGAVNGPEVPGSRTVKFVMQHPEVEKTQIVVELLLNENMKE